MTVLVIVAAMGGVLAACAPDGDDPGRAYTYLAAPGDGGTGKVYLGREIAALSASAEDSAWLDRPTRETSELPDRVVEALSLKPAQVIADIGAGTGYYSFRLARRVPHGKVLAVDIQTEMLEIIQDRAAERNISNIDTVLGTTGSPRLPAGSIDVALIVDSYHEFLHPYEMMSGIVAALRPRGEVILVEYRGEDETLAIPKLHRLTQDQAIKEMDFVGLRWKKTLDILPQHHLMIFEKR